MGVIDYLNQVRERDPAAGNNFEIVMAYPGVQALASHRVNHWLWNRHMRLLARLFSQISKFLTGIEIHPGAKVGKNFFIDHGMGVVIGETAEVGDNVTLFQGVTLGGTGKEKGKRHPTLGNNVVVAAGAQILGGITIGDNVRVGAGSVVVRPVPADATIVGVPGRIVARRGKEVPVVDLHHERLPDPIAEMFNSLHRRIDHLEHQMEDEIEKRKKGPS
jgi:serine O-acetyltransferase